MRNEEAEKKLKMDDSWPVEPSNASSETIPKYQQT
jgi:hypothetical protein